MEAYEVKFRDYKHVGEQTAYAFAISAASAIKKVCKKFKVSDRDVTGCVRLGGRIAF